MSAEAVLARLLRANVMSWFEGEDFCFRAPAGGLDPALRALVVEHKPGLRLLMGQQRRHAPASFAQERIWFTERWTPGRPVFTITALAFEIRGPLDTEALERALADVAARQDSLRTHFLSVEGILAQVIEPNQPAPLEILDLTAVPPDRLLDRVREAVEARASAPFDLEQGPLFRAHLVMLGPAHHVLFAPVHHIISDGWSMGVLMKDWLTAYGARIHGGPPAWKPLPMSCAEYAQELRADVESAQVRNALEYWTRHLADWPDRIALPFVPEQANGVTDQAGAQFAFRIDEELTRQIRAFSHREGVSPFMTAMAAFQAVLYRYSGQERFNIGTGSANRSRPSLAGLIGLFVNTLVLRAEVNGGLTFRELLARVRETALAAYEHRQAPFEQLVARLNPVRAPGVTPLFNVSFILHNLPRPGLGNGNLTFNRFPAHTGVSQFDLSVAIEERFDAWDGLIEYRSAAMTSGGAARLANHFSVLFEAALRAPDTPVDALPMLDPAEHRGLLHDWAFGERMAAPAENMLARSIAGHATTHPNAVAVAAQGHILTYAALDRRASSLARALLDRGIAPGQIVAVMMDRSAELVIALLGTYRAGAVYLPIDPAWPRSRQVCVLEDADAKLLITNGALAGTLPGFAVPLLVLDCDALDGTDPAASLPEPDGSALAYVIYTSGTTGVPKGVAIERRALQNLVTWHQKTYALSPRDRGALVAGVAFDASLWEMWPALAAGAALYIAPESVRYSPAAMRDWMLESGITISFMPTPLAEELIQLPWPSPCPLHALLTGGDRLRRYPSRDLPFELVNHYGPTENTVVSTWAVIRPCAQAASPPPIGRPIANTSAYILDRHMQPVPIGVPGLLYLGGAGLARGYYRQPDMTLRAFVPNPFEEDAAARLYRTGDRARWREDGQIEFLGREDRQIKLRGFRVEVQEIESQLTQHPDVRAAAVLALEEEDGEKTLAAYVVPNDPGSFDMRALLDFLKKRVPAYMAPSRAATLDTLPMTLNGKIDFDRLATVRTERIAALGPFRRPESPLEQELATMLREFLPCDPVGLDDNFFEMGGHSLLAVRWLSRIEARFGIAWPLSAFFENPTIAGAAAWISGHGDGAPEDGAPPPRPGEIPLSTAQQRIWLAGELQDAHAAYIINALLRCHGPLDTSLLSRSLDELIAGHEILRTAYRASGPEPVQVVLPPAACPLEYIDLRCDCTEDAGAIIAREAVRPFDLRTAPVLRAHLLRCAEDEHLLLLSMHHIASDGWSLGLLLQEFAKRYSAHAQGGGLPTAPSRWQYADYAVWERAQADSEARARARTYWEEHLKGMQELKWPARTRRVDVPSMEAHTITMDWPETLATQLREIARTGASTLFSVLYTAMAALLHRHCSTNDIAVGMPVANRPRPCFQDVAGCFINLVVLRTRLEPAAPFMNALQDVHEILRNALTNAQTPFEELVELLRPPRIAGRHPLVQTVFAFNEAPPATLSFGPATAKLEPAPEQVTRFELEFHTFDSGVRLQTRVIYAQDAFDTSFVESLLREWRTMLEHAVRWPDTRLCELPVWSADEAFNVITEWNQTQTLYPSVETVQAVFQAWAASQPGAEAVIDGDYSLTYGELNRRANRLAHWLRQRVAPEEIVAVQFERGAGLAVALLAILKAGAAYLPLDPDAPAVRAAHILRTAHTRLVLTDPVHARSLEPPPDVQVVCLDAIAAALEAYSDENVADIPDGRRLAYAIFTSGSTGEPKGVCVEHRAILRLVRETNYIEIVPGDTVAMASTPAFDAATFELWGPLLNGARAAVVSRDTLFEPAALARQIEAGQISVLFMTTALFHHYARVQPDAFRRLQTLLFGGETADPAAATAVLAAGPPARLLHVYGPTEVTTFATWHEVTSIDPMARTVPIGKPISNTRAYVLDGQLRPVPPGMPAELFLGGDGVARGYLNDPELSGARFLPDPFTGDDQGRMYRTGDLVVQRPNGDIEFLGRRDTQVKLRGFRIELGEIEYALRQHPEVADAAAELRDMDGITREIAAYVTLRAGATLSGPDVIAFLRQYLPAYMIPRACMILDQFPLTANGKLDRAALPKPHQTTPPTSAAVDFESETVRGIAGLWSELLGAPARDLDENFFDAGGYSLLALRLLEQVRLRFGVDVPIHTFLTDPRLRVLAGCVESRISIQRETPLPLHELLVPVQPHGQHPPLFCCWPAGGTSFMYYPLAPRLGAGQPLYVLQDPALDPSRNPARSVEEMASECIKAIRLVQPCGPYHVCGWSFGGTLAYEMACQLEEAGETVRRLILIDAHALFANAARGHTWQRVSSRLIRYFFIGMSLLPATLGFLAEGLGLIALSPHSRRNGWRERVRARYAARMLRKMGAVSVAAQNGLLRNMHLPALRRVFLLYYMHEQAGLRYRPRPYGGRIDLLRATDHHRMIPTRNDPELGWGGYARGGVRVKPVRGNHSQMLGPRGIDQIAAHIMSLLLTND